MLLNDWYDGRIDQTYPVHCYRDALKHLPADVQTYSSAHDDILRALQTRDREAAKDRAQAGRARTRSCPPATKTTADSGSGTGDDRRRHRFEDRRLAGTPGRPAGSPARLNPASPSSLPVPLLVLGGLALLLVAAGGAGLVAKRVQSRRPSP